MYGVRAGYRTGMAWTVQANLSYSVPEARYTENNNSRPNVDVKTTQLELGLLGQAKLTASSLALGDLNDKIAFAEGTAVVNPLDGGIATFFVLSAGLTFQL